MLQVGYADMCVGGLAAGSRPDQDMTALRPRGLKLVVLDQQPGELASQGGPFGPGNFRGGPFLVWGFFAAGPFEA